jgi:formylmethanofuran dehydrogenase subunit E
MIETYTTTAKAIDQLGSASTSVTSKSLVCDMCGFKFDKKDLVDVKGRKLCIICMDDDPKKDNHISGRSR